MAFSKNWRPTDPAGSALVSTLDNEIQDYKEAARERLDKEHEYAAGATIDDDTKCGQHKEGSARAYYQAAAPTPLAGYQEGRLWIDSDDNDRLYFHNGTSFVTPAVDSVQAASGTVILPSAVSPAQTAEASAVWDSDNDLLTVGTGTGRKTMVDTEATQTLTNKTLTSPVVNTPTVTNGTVSLAGGTFVFPGATTPAQTAEGSAVWDTDGDLLTVGTGSVRKTMVDTNSTQTLSGKTLTAPTINAATLTGTLSGGTFTTTTLTSPTIGNFTNATHNHTSAATGGIVAHSALSGSGSNAHSVIDTHLAATATHGATGAVVGTTNSQTLTNKTLTAPVLNSVPVSSTMAGDPTAALAIATKQYVDKWPVTCTVRRGSDQTLNSSQIIAWNTEEHDPEGIHSGGTVTAPTGATRVRLTYWLKITGGGSASSVAIRKNGTDITAEHLTPVGDTDYQYCQTPWLTCAGGNTFDVYFTWVANCTLRYSTAITTPTTISLDKIGSWLYSYFTVEFSL